jgi:redox-sensitive bicupin YhaK (pirin superfamily)
MSYFGGLDDPNPGDAPACDAIEQMIIPSSRDIGGFSVKRALPTARRRMVGPFIFLRPDGACDPQGRRGHGRAPASAYRAFDRDLPV